MIRTDRVEQLAALLVAELEQLPEAAILEAMPAGVSTTVKLARRLGVDLVGDLRRSAISSVQGLPALCIQDPDRAQRILDRSIGVVAWLDDQTDAPPVALLT